MGVVFEAVGGDEGEEDVLAGVGLGAEGVEACGESLLFGKHPTKCIL